MIDLRKEYQKAVKRAKELMYSGNISGYLRQLNEVENLKLKLAVLKISA